MRLTISAVQEQDGVSAAENGNQPQVHFGGVCLLGVRHKVDIAMAAAATGCRLRDDFLVVLHVQLDAEELRTCAWGVVECARTLTERPLGTNG
jgi:hypothetical protein